MTPAGTKSSNQSKAKFAAVGDIFLGDQPLCLGFGVRSLAQRHGYGSLFTEVKEIFSQYELVVGNLETVIACRAAVETPKAAGRVDRAEPEAAAAMRHAGINLVGLANNHIFEYAESGLNETVRHLDAVGIAWAGKKNHRIQDVAGAKVAFLSWSLLPDTYWPDRDPADHYNVAKSIAPILEEIATVKDVADYVVLLLHWGNELVSRPSKTQQEIGRELVDAGVNVVLGHHPHVLQPIERYKDGVIVYSLGNFVMDSWECASRTSVMLEITLGKFVEYRVIPVTIDARKYRPTLTQDAVEASRILSILEYGEPMEDSAYLQLVYRERKRYRLSSLVHFIKNIHRIGIQNMAWILAWGMRRVFFLVRVASIEKKDPDVVYRGPMH